MRKLLSCLVTHDAVTFLDLLHNLRSVTHSPTSSPPFWLMTHAAQRLFQHAKERVYTVHSTEGDKPKMTLKRVLEPNPKWTLLLSVLEEVSSAPDPPPRIDRVPSSASPAHACMRGLLQRPVVPVVPLIHNKSIRYRSVHLVQQHPN